MSLRFITAVQTFYILFKKLTRSRRTNLPFSPGRIGLNLHKFTEKYPRWGPIIVKLQDVRW